MCVPRSIEATDIFRSVRNITDDEDNFDSQVKDVWDNAGQYIN